MSEIIIPRGADQFVVRFPDGMRDMLKEAAGKNGRSMNTEIVARLAWSFGPKPEETKPHAQVIVDELAKASNNPATMKGLVKFLLALGEAYDSDLELKEILSIPDEAEALRRYEACRTKLEKKG